MNCQSRCEDVDLNVRDMRVDDYEAMIELWRLSGLSYSAQGRDSREAIGGQLQDPRSIYFVAECEGRLVATALCSDDGRKGWINRLAVLPDYQGQGIGGMMVDEAERRFRARGLEVFSCLIMLDNARSQEMFSHLGYRRHDDVVYFSKRTRDEA